MSHFVLQIITALSLVDVTGLALGEIVTIICYQELRVTR
jgi:hypothetical protein